MASQACATPTAPQLPLSIHGPNSCILCFPLSLWTACLATTLSAPAGLVPPSGRSSVRPFQSSLTRATVALLSSCFAWPECCLIVCQSGISTTFTGTRIPNYEVACDANNPFRVLIVGAGLTGCLTALHLRLEWDKQPRSRPLVIHVWERANYPAGRHGAVSVVQGEGRADMGSQCVSLKNPNDPRAGELHGPVTMEDMQRAWRVMQELTANGVLSAVSDSYFDPRVEERVIDEGLWKHFWARSGMDSVLRHIFMEAKVNAVQFGTRVDRLAKTPKGKIAATGFSNKEGNLRAPLTKEFDSVIVTAPAPNAAQIEGLEDMLGEEDFSNLQSIGYDSRIAETVVYGEEFVESLERAFKERPEIITSSDEANKLKIHLLAWQGPKRVGAAVELQALSARSVVAHSVVGARSMPLSAVHEAVAKRIGMKAADVEAHMREQRRIHWHVCSVTKPMHIVLGRNPKHKYLGSSKVPGLFVTGDYMTHSGFLGADASAYGTAKAVVDQNGQ